MAASTRSKKTGINLPFSSKMADVCLQIKCREQRDYPPCNSVHSNLLMGVKLEEHQHTVAITISETVQTSGHVATTTDMQSSKLRM